MGGKGGKGFGEHGLPNLAWALAWEGHAGLHFFTRFPKGVVNPFIYSLPEGFTVERKWWGQDGDHWSTTHDVRYDSRTNFGLTSGMLPVTRWKKRGHGLRSPLAMCES